MRRYRRSFFYFFPIGFRLSVFVATHFTYDIGVTSYTKRHATTKRSSRRLRNPPSRIAKQRTCELWIWGGKSSQSQRISFKNGRWPSSYCPIRTWPLNTTWHNLLCAALATSKAFSCDARGTVGGAEIEIDGSFDQWTPETRLWVQNGPAVTEHRWSCSTVAMLVIKALPPASPTQPSSSSR